MSSSILCPLSLQNQYFRDKTAKLVASLGWPLAPWTTVTAAFVCFSWFKKLEACHQGTFSIPCNLFYSGQDRKLPFNAANLFNDYSLFFCIRFTAILIWLVFFSSPNWTFFHFYLPHGLLFFTIDLNKSDQ